MTLKVEQNTQILNFKSIVLNQEGFSKPKFILPHHNLVCRTSYPKKREKKIFGVQPIGHVPVINQYKIYAFHTSKMLILLKTLEEDCS